MNDHNDHDPHGILMPGNLGAFGSVCRACGCRFPGALGHGPPCACPGPKPDALIEAALPLLPPEKAADPCPKCKGKGFVEYYWYTGQRRGHRCDCPLG